MNRITCPFKLFPNIEKGYFGSKTHAQYEIQEETCQVLTFFFFHYKQPILFRWMMRTIDFHAKHCEANKSC